MERSDGYVPGCCAGELEGRLVDLERGDECRHGEGHLLENCLQLGPRVPLLTASQLSGRPALVM